MSCRSTSGNSIYGIFPLAALCNIANHGTAVYVSKLAVSSKEDGRDDFRACPGDVASIHYRLHLSQQSAVSLRDMEET